MTQRSEDAENLPIAYRQGQSLRRADRRDGPDQATTNLHEAAHLRQVKGTEDYGGDGCDFLQSLAEEENLNQADTFATFANASNLRCQGE
ncbi:hypothetical protein LLEC1_03141, partial [Akanthomyces lecanii]